MKREFQTFKSFQSFQTFNRFQWFHTLRRKPIQSLSAVQRFNNSKLPRSAALKESPSRTELRS